MYNRHFFSKILDLGFYFQITDTFINISQFLHIHFRILLHLFSIDPILNNYLFISFFYYINL
jgi:hypothetical protein